MVYATKFLISSAQIQLSKLQIRFLMEKGYDKLLVQTELWKSG